MLQEQDKQSLLEGQYSLRPVQVSAEEWPLGLWWKVEN